MPRENSRIFRGATARVGIRGGTGFGARVLIGVMGLGLVSCATGQTAAASEAAGVGALMDRVGAPSASAVEEFKAAGMEDVQPHVLSAAERAKVADVLASLPELNRRVLGTRLHSLAFVDGIPGEGTGLTSPVGKTGMYDITLRASILGEPLSKFLTIKEQRIFSDDGSGNTVAVTGSGTDAVTYVLLHESTHVMDFACGITKQPQTGVGAGVWVSQKQLEPALAASPATHTYFRGGAKIPLRQALGLYDALALTPFVTVYSTAEPQDDLAELVAWREIQKQHHGDLVITVTNAEGKRVGRWEPLSFPAVDKRLQQVDRLLASPSTCAALAE